MSSIALRSQRVLPSALAVRAFATGSFKGHQPAAPQIPRLNRAGAVAAAGLAAAALPPLCQGTRTFASCESPASKPEIVESFPAGLDLKRATVKLYQFESCPFCRKVRGCLDFHRIPYEIIEVHPLNKAETKDIAPDYKKVPILEVRNEQGVHLQMRDSKRIIVALLGESAPEIGAGIPPPVATPSTGKMIKEEEGSVEELWVKWTDSVLVQCIVLNVYRTLSESAETFKYLLTHPAFSWLEQQTGAVSGTVVMWGVAKSRKKRFEVADERKALYEAVELFAEAVRKGEGRFLGGDRPGKPDFNVYGILRSTEGCQTERDIFDNCTLVKPWWDAMNEVVGSSQAINKDSVQRG